MTQEEIDFFDHLAPEWDANEILSTPERINSILDKLHVKEGMKVLDLGTGTGILLPYLSKRVGEKGYVTGIDLSDGMLSLAKKKFGNIKNVQLLKLDFEEDVIPGTYDLIILYSVYPHLHFPAETIEWLFKMNIKEDGCIVIAFPCDEEFINNIHHERKSESEHLPSANVLAERIRKWGFYTEVISATTQEYIIKIRKKNI